MVLFLAEEYSLPELIPAPNAALLQDTELLPLILSFRVREVVMASKSRFSRSVATKMAKDLARHGDMFDFIRVSFRRHGEILKNPLDELEEGDGHFICYLVKKPQFKNMTRLEKSRARFEDCYALYLVCSVCRMTFHFGPEESTGVPVEGPGAAPAEESDTQSNGEYFLQNALMLPDGMFQNQQWRLN